MNFYMNNYIVFLILIWCNALTAMQKDDELISSYSLARSCAELVDSLAKAEFQESPGDKLFRSAIACSEKDTDIFQTLNEHVYASSNPAWFIMGENNNEERNLVLYKNSKAVEIPLFEELLTAYTHGFSWLKQGWKQLAITQVWGKFCAFKG